MKKYFVLTGVFLLLGGVITTTIFSDVMIKSYPPLGTPLDWIHTRLPRRAVIYDPAYKITPSSIEAEPKNQPAPEPEPITPSGGATVAAKLDSTQSAKMIKSYRIPFDPFSAEFAVLTCKDMKWHFQWLPGVMATDPCKPLLDPFFQQMLIVMVVQMGLYPECFPEAQTAQYLLELGEPALVVADGILAFKTPIQNDDKSVCKPAWAQGLATYLKQQIGEPAKQPPPEAPKGNTPFETMVNRLIVEELGKDYYFSVKTNFANRLRLLGEAIAPYISNAAQKNDHSLIRHNAAALLGSYDSPAALAALREIVKGDDAVSRNRALSALIQKGDKEIIPFLIDSLKNGDKYFKVYAAYALGALGAKQAVKPLLDYLASDPNNLDIIWAVVPALGTIGDAGDEVTTALRKVADRKIFTSHSMALLALAALGEKDALTELKIEEGQDPLKRLEPQVHYIAVALLALGGKKNTPLLLEVVKSKSHNVQLRLNALQNATFTPEHIPALKSIIQDEKMPPVLQAYALYKLTEFKDKDIVSLAKTLLNQALTNFGTPKFEREGGGFEGVIALRILGALNLAKESDLSQVINQIYNQLKSKPPKKQKDDDDTVIVSSAPLLETAILELGKLKSKEAGKTLVHFLALPDFPRQAEAALALGQTPADKTTIETLIKTLADENGWTRYCAYLSLNKLTGKDFTCEWVFDPPEERKKAIDQWGKWWKEEGSK